MPLVSVIIPCHNAAPWLAETLGSALAQTWAEKEIMLIDDGSTDNSLALARTFEARGVRVLSQSRRGAAAARNTGMREARGDFLQFLDADDLLSPDKISAQVRLLAAATPGHVASCAWGRFAGTPQEARFVDELVFRDLSPLEFLLLAGDRGAMMHPAAWLVPRPLAAAAGPWDERLTLNDDGEYFCRVLLASRGIRFSTAGRSFYRSRLRSSLSQRTDAAALESLFLSVELFAAHLLAAEDAPRIRLSLANYYQRFIYTAYPAVPELVRKAHGRIESLGGATVRPEMGSRTAFLARILGWKTVWRLKRMLAALHPAA
jgi:glycosyltransferase involved in cell wall biosynthesis